MACRFDLPYVALSLPADVLKAWEQPPSSSANGLAMPQQNHFIPADFSLKSDTAASKDSKAKQAAEALLTALPTQAAKVSPPWEIPVLASVILIVTRLLPIRSHSPQR